MKTFSKRTQSQNGLNREGWLTELAAKMEAFFKGFSLSPYRLTCGWPCKNAISPKMRRIGECHSLGSSRGGLHEIFISPLLHEPLEVAGTVAHEMAHVAAGIEAAHGPRFVKVCKHVGLTKGKPTSVGPGPELVERLKKITDGLGAYPHSGMILTAKVVKSPSTLSLKCVNCDCRVSISVKWLQQAGPPTCGCGGVFGVGTG